MIASSATDAVTDRLDANPASGTPSVSAASPHTSAFRRTLSQLFAGLDAVSGNAAPPDRENQRASMETPSSETALIRKGCSGRANTSQSSDTDVSPGSPKSSAKERVTAAAEDGLLEATNAMTSLAAALTMPAMTPPPTPAAANNKSTAATPRPKAAAQEKAASKASSPSASSPAGESALASLLAKTESAPRVSPDLGLTATAATSGNPANCQPVDTHEATAPIEAAPPIAPTAEAPESPDGTAPAQNNTPMKQDQEMNETAVSAEQKLPSTGSARRIPSLETKTTEDSPAKPGGNSTSSMDTLAAQGLVSNQFNSQVEQREATGLEAKAAEPTSVAQAVQRQVVHHVSVMSQVNASTSSAVLRPDSQTEISLRVRKTASGMEVELRCDRGDATMLNTHWEELRQSLAQQGMRLAPLRTANPSDNSTAHSSSHESARPAPEQNHAGTPGHQRRAQESLAEGHCTDTNNRSPRSTKTPQSTGRARRWETWA